ncbi:hypothetical protein YC2023_036727 [Brassica napus]
MASWFRHAELWPSSGGSDMDLRFIILLAIVTTVVAIKSSDGEDVNCVDKKKQPAFENILLKNHVLQVLLLL